MYDYKCSISIDNVRPHFNEFIDKTTNVQSISTVLNQISTNLYIYLNKCSINIDKFRANFSGFIYTTECPINIYKFRPNFHEFIYTTECPINNDKFRPNFNECIYIYTYMYNYKCSISNTSHERYGRGF